MYPGKKENIVEYSVHSWAPLHYRDMGILETVQWRASKMEGGLEQLCYESLQGTSIHAANSGQGLLIKEELEWFPPPVLN